jgi:hypothetical protein
MSPIVVIVIVVVIVVIALAWIAMRKRRTDDLKQTFGPEYDRAVHETTDKRQAESMLVERKKRVESFETVPLSQAQRQAFTDRWQDVQALFVDDPAGAISRADGLIAEVMEARGYPAEAFEQREEIISVEQPEVVENYRTAHEITGRSESGDASTDDLRQAMLLYRSIFDQLTAQPQETTA